MKDWIVARIGEQKFWLTRIEARPDGRITDYLCGICDGPLEDSVVVFFDSFRGSPGTVAYSICWHCQQLPTNKPAAGELYEQVGLLLAEAASA